MNPTLRPMSLGEILDRTVRLYRAQFLTYAAVAAIPAVVMLMVHLADLRWWHTGRLFEPGWRGGELLWTFVLSLGFYHIACLVTLPTYVTYANLVQGAVLRTPVGLRGALQFTLRRWRSVVWLTVLKILASLLAPELIAVAVLIGVAAAFDSAGGFEHYDRAFSAIVVFAIPLVFMVCLIVWLAAAFGFAHQSNAVEDVRGTRAMRRSWQLTRGGRWRIVAAWLLILVFVWGFSIGMQLLNSWAWYLAGRSLHLGRNVREIYYASRAFLNAAITTVLGPLYPIAVTLLYYDQRIRREGFDVELMMQAAGMEPAAEVAAPTVSAPPVAAEEAP